MNSFGFKKKLNFVASLKSNTSFAAILAASFLISSFSVLFFSTKIGITLSNGSYDFLALVRNKLILSPFAAQQPKISAPLSAPASPLRKLSPAQSPIVIIAIDEMTLTSPRLSIPEVFQHHHYTEIINNLYLGEALAVVFNFVLPRSE
ncbi:MAG: hypothetical protein ACRCTY_08500, partial [Candidatus Adiutrix sp.]